MWVATVSLHAAISPQSCRRPPCLSQNSWFTDSQLALRADLAKMPVCPIPRWDEPSQAEQDVRNWPTALDAVNRWSRGCRYSQRQSRLSEPSCRQLAGAAGGPQRARVQRRALHLSHPAEETASEPPTSRRGAELQGKRERGELWAAHASSPRASTGMTPRFHAVPGPKRPQSLLSGSFAVSWTRLFSPHRICIPI